MRITTWLGASLLLFAVALFGLALFGVLQVVTAVVLDVVLAILSVPCFALSAMANRHDRDAARVRELPEIGIRVRGTVLDVLQSGSPHGGAVFQAGGAQMVLHVELDRGEGRRERVSVHVVEPSDEARARVGSSVTVLEHPEDRSFRALAGHYPNGRRAG